MKKIVRLIFSAGLQASLLLTTSCEDDPPVNPKLSFAASSITVNEAEGIIEVEVVLDRPAFEDFTIDYEISNSSTAQDAETATDISPPDFLVLEDLNDYGEIEIEKGETSGLIQIEIWSDFVFEGNPETIVIKILDVDSDLIEITHDDIEITVEQEDGLIIYLDWAYTTVDMDLLLWAENGSGTLVLTEIGSARELYFGPESFILPNVLVDGDYGVSCTYYGTTVDPPSALSPMNFTLSYFPFTNGSLGTEIIREGVYDEGNLNPWLEETGTDPLLAATFTKTGGTYTNFSDILIDANTTGSRTTGAVRNLNLTKGLANRITVKEFLVSFR